MNTLEIQNDKFNRFLINAIVFHIVVSSILYFSHKLDFLPSRPIKLNDVELIQSAVRIDIVGMPKLTVQELKKVQIEKVTPKDIVEKAIEESKPNETSDIEFKKVAKKIDLKNLLSDLSQKKVKKKVKKKTAVNKEALRKLILEGNIVSQGSSAVGDKVALSKQEFTAYLQSLPARIQPYWKLPSYLMDQELRCRIRVFIGHGGKVLKTEIYESSGVEEYDKKALAAIEAAAPLPAPKSEIIIFTNSGEVVVGFPL